MWLYRADGLKRSTADLKRLASVARNRKKRAADAVAGHKRDQQALDQRRRQREQHDRRAAPAVAKTMRPQLGQCSCPAHAVCGMCVDQGKLAAAEQAAVDLDTRFQASTNVVMDLERPEDETAELLPRCRARLRRDEAPAAGRVEQRAHGARAVGARVRVVRRARPVVVVLAG